MFALPRKKIRLHWIVTRHWNRFEHVDQGSLPWENDTPDMRAELAALASLGNERFGAATHWVEPEPNELLERRCRIQSDCLSRARASARERLFIEHLDKIEVRMKEVEV